MTALAILVSILAVVSVAAAYVTVATDQVGDDATYPNQGRHIIKDALINRLHVCWGWSGGSWLMYSSSDDLGDNWENPQRIWEPGNDIPMYDPAIAVDKVSRPWVAATHSYVIINENPHGGRLYVLRQEQNPQQGWDQYYSTWWDNHDIGPASVVVSNGGIGDEPMAYVVVPVEETNLMGEPTGHHTLHFHAIDEQGSRYDCVVAEIQDPDQGDFIRASIDYLPGDIIHVVYQIGWPRTLYHRYAQAPGGPNYFRNGGTLTWSDPVQVSRWYCEPAQYPSFDADGDILIAAWQAHGYVGPMEAWYNKRYLWEPGADWRNPRLLSPDNNLRAGLPSVGSRLACAWQEATEQAQPYEEEVYAGCLGETRNISSSADEASLYPHCHAVILTPGVFIVTAFNLWTEFVEGEPWVVFQRSDFVPIFGGQEKVPGYLNVHTGEATPSVYCLERTGYKVLGSHSLDFGKVLKYRLPFLEPTRSYVLALNLYHEERGTVDYEFVADGEVIARVNVPPGEVTTVYPVLPMSGYAKDFEVELEVRSPDGAPVSLADGFKAYLVPGGEQGDEQQGGSQPAPATQPALRVAPNPVAGQARVRYTLLCAGMTRVWISDATGRTIRVLASGNLQSGRHETVWNGTDAAGADVPNGVYFVNLRAVRSTATSPLRLAR